VAAVGAVLTGRVVVVAAGALAVLAVRAVPSAPSDLAGATAESSWPKPSAAIGHWWNT
jgi:hypothetical protein